MSEICKKCGKDHTVKNEGKLTVCEKAEYFSQGGNSKDSKAKRIFGAGEQRFQFEGAR